MTSWQQEPWNWLPQTFIPTPIIVAADKQIFNTECCYKLTKQTSNTHRATVFTAPHNGTTTVFDPQAYKYMYHSMFSI